MDKEGLMNGPPGDVKEITLVTNAPAPYKTPRLNALSRRSDVELNVLYANDRTGRRHYTHIPDQEFEFQLMDSRVFSVGKTDFLFNLGIPRALWSDPVDALVVGGWSTMLAWQALIVSKLRNIPIAIISENADQRTKFGEILGRGLVPHFDAYLPVSTRAKRNLIKLGADSSSITVLPYCIDVDVFQSIISEKGQEGIRNEYQIYEKNIVLFVGALTRRKGVGDLIKAVDALETDSVRLFIVGDGPMDSQLRSLASQRGVPTTFAGSVPNKQLPNYYAIASVFVLPSRREHWGLVQNEALACGTPVVSTRASGAVGDLILDGRTGLVVEPGSVNQLTSAIERILGNSQMRKEMSQSCLRLSSEFTPKRYASLINSAVNKMLEPKA